ncbi:hypothetical protein [Ensifer sp. ENS12]|uniref:hypothetical protein n=1 Tax=Ensifer sp. ENS12 TaxID=2854774 RepID=UPI002106D791|nr:hypothetical protein [Ensifer sp. ENS12]
MQSTKSGTTTALILGKETDRHRRAGDEDRGHALADLDGLAFLAAPPLLDAAFGVAVIEPGDAVAQYEIQQHGRRIDRGKQGDKGEAILEKGAQIEIRCSEGS